MGAFRGAVIAREAGVMHFDRTGTPVVYRANNSDNALDSSSRASSSVMESTSGEVSSRSGLETNSPLNVDQRAHSPEGNSTNTAPLAGLVKNRVPAGKESGNLAKEDIQLDNAINDAF